MDNRIDYYWLKGYLKICGDCGEPLIEKRKHYGFGYEPDTGEKYEMFSVNLKCPNHVHWWDFGHTKVTLIVDNNKNSKWIEHYGLKVIP